MSGLGAYRLFRVRVAAAERVTPGFVRVKFTGDELDEFGFVGIDQRVKLLLPDARGVLPELHGGGDWYAAWCALSAAEQPPMRTYTPRLLRRANPATGEPASLVIDFAWHPNPGPAAAWAAAARPGDLAAIVGPNGAYSANTRAVGWLPPRDATRLLLVGDESSLPAIAAILEDLDAAASVRVLLELGDPRDVALLGDTDGVTVEVHERGGRHPGDALVDAVRALDDPAFAPAARARSGPTASPELEDVDLDATVLWEVPGIDPETGMPAEDDARSARAYAWLAGEADAIKRIRRELVAERGMPREAVAFMGYWRFGRAER
ncbi:siderophore-interacting protein [Leucobacter chromiireducens]|uniref:siderophore-interacting protein n=1 Tax=Leucobacter chromiireducens TaxID=283877 RepID=UPI000F63106D|nr:siderophore-interacting protein [Leucobacter chromiireducens]